MAVAEALYVPPKIAQYPVRQGFGKSRPFAKKEQWEPDVEAASNDWRSDAGKLGRGNRRAEKEDPLDKLLWSQDARDINRNMGFN